MNAKGKVTKAVLVWTIVVFVLAMPLLAFADDGLIADFGFQAGTSALSESSVDEGPCETYGSVKLYTESKDGHSYSLDKTIFRASDGAMEECPGITYDRASNTVTLSDFKGADKRLDLSDMGEDCVLRVTGENELLQVTVGTSYETKQERRGVALRISGDGVLKVNASAGNSAIGVRAGFTASKLVVDASVKLRLTGAKNGYSLVQVYQTTIDDPSQALVFQGDVVGESPVTEKRAAGKGINGKQFNLGVYDYDNALSLEAFESAGMKYGVDRGSGQVYELYGGANYRDGEFGYLARKTSGGVEAPIRSSDSVKAFELLYLAAATQETGYSPMIEGKVVCSAKKTGDSIKSYVAAGPFDEGDGSYEWMVFEGASAQSGSVTIDGVYYYLAHTIQQGRVSGTELAPDGYETNWYTWPDCYTHRISGSLFTQGYPAEPAASSGEKASSGNSVTTKAANPMKVRASAKTVKAKQLKKKTKTVNGLKVSGAVGKVTFKNASTSKKLKKFKVAPMTGKVTVPKNTKKGTYKVKVKVTAAGNAKYKALSKTVTCTIKVK